MPLQPRLREACRLCQLMHVLSFGEGRKLVLLFCFQWRDRNQPVQIATICRRLPKQVDTFRVFRYKPTLNMRETLNEKLVNL